jgi:hypothetical protein
MDKIKSLQDKPVIIEYNANPKTAWYSKFTIMYLRTKPRHRLLILRHTPEFYDYLHLAIPISRNLS